MRAAQLLGQLAQIGQIIKGGDAHAAQVAVIRIGVAEDKERDNLTKEDDNMRQAQLLRQMRLGDKEGNYLTEGGRYYVPVAVIKMSLAGEQAERTV